MENSGEVNIQTQIQHKTKRSPQEIAASVLEVYSTGMEHTGHPEGKELDQKYQDSKEKIKKLLETGVDDETLSLELNGFYEESKKLGFLNPVENEDIKKFFPKDRAFYSNIGLSEEKVEEKMREQLSRRGIWAEFKRWRRSYEKDINKKFSTYTESHLLSKTEESEEILKLEGKRIRLENPDQSQELKYNFPNGNYLFHGTKVGQAIDILSSGNLVNYKSLHDQEEERFVKEGGDKKFGIRNSGYEGISWSFNQIDALPGDRYHLVGFLASPNEILNDSLQLSVPSRPAPNELILIDKDIDAKKFYEIKTQQELLLNIGLGESNSVLSNLCHLDFCKENKKSDKPNPYLSKSMLIDFSESEMSDNEIEQLLRSKYSIRDNQTVQFSPDLLQQVDKNIPVGAVWLQALIDTGRIKNIPGFEDIKTIRHAILKTESYKIFLDEFRKDKFYLENEVNEEDDKVTAINIPVSELYLVLPNTDLKQWLKVITRAPVKPKGILTYNHQEVRLENFASIHQGDNNNLSRIIRNAIPLSEGYIDFEEDILGEEILKEKLAGHRHQIIGEQFLSNRKSIVKNSDGLTVI